MNISDFSDTIEALKEVGFLSVLEMPGIDRMVHEYIETEDIYVTITEQGGICSVSVERYIQPFGGLPGKTTEVLPITPFSTTERLIELLQSTEISIFNDL